MRLHTLLFAATALTGFAHVALSQTISFAPAPFAADDAAKRAVVATASASVGGMDKATGFHTLLRTGDKLGDNVFGQLMTADGKAIAGEISRNPDFTSLLPKGDRLYAISHFEEVPAALYLTELKADADGNLTAISTKPVDLSQVGGVWDPCAGSVTPWARILGPRNIPMTPARSRLPRKTRTCPKKLPHSPATGGLIRRP